MRIALSTALGAEAPEPLMRGALSTALTHHS